MKPLVCNNTGHNTPLGRLTCCELQDQTVLRLLAIADVLRQINKVIALLTVLLSR